MQISNDNPSSISSDAEWCLLGEYPLNELMIELDNPERTNTGALFLTIREMGILPELLSTIERRLIEFTREVMAHLNQSRAESPVKLRLFYKNKTAENVRSANSSRLFNTALNKELKEIIHQSDARINGGWGYFLIERGGGFPPGSTVKPCNWIDLYLYKEGE